MCMIVDEFTELKWQGQQYNKNVISWDDVNSFLKSIRDHTTLLTE